MGNDVIDVSAGCEKLTLESGPCGNGKDWKVGLVGEVEEELRREPLDSLDDNINDIAGDVVEERVHGW